MFILHLATESVQQFYNKKGTVYLLTVLFRSINFMTLSIQSENSEFTGGNCREGWRRTTSFLPPQEQRSDLELKHKIPHKLLNAQALQLTGSPED